MRNQDIHTPAGKRAFIYQYMAGMRKALLDAIPKMPDEWDGHELRWLTADKCIWEAEPRFNKKNKRVREYKNEVIVKNII